MNDARMAGVEAAGVEAAGIEVVGMWQRAADTYETVVAYFQRMGERLVARAELTPGERVLDAACGNGASLVPAARAVGSNGTAVGVDIAPAMVAAARTALVAAGIEHAEVRVMDAGCLEFPDDSFDVVLCGAALGFIGMDRGLFEFSRVLRPGGRVLASVPTGGGPNWSFFGELCQRYGLAPLPFSAPNPAETKATFARAGLCDLEVFDETIHVVFPDEEAWWRWAWSHGQRWFLEQLPADRVEEFKRSAFAHLRSFRTDEGIPLDQSFLTARAWCRPG